MNEVIWQNASAVFGGAFVAILALIFIASRTMVSWKKAIAEVKVADAEGEIYKKLSNRNENLEKILGEVYHENKDLIMKVGRLEGFASNLTEASELIQKLKLKLDSKDDQFELLIKSHAEERAIFYEVLTRKDSELAKRDEQVLNLTKAVHELELRLASDERRLVQIECPHTDRFSTQYELPIGCNQEI